MRYMRNARAAVAAEFIEDKVGGKAVVGSPPARPAPEGNVAVDNSARTLWASRHLRLSTEGLRAVGVRLTAGGALMVAVVDARGGGIAWAPAREVMTEAQAERWARTSNFRV